MSDPTGSILRQQIVSVWALPPNEKLHLTSTLRTTNELAGVSLPLPRHRCHRCHDRISDLVFDREDIFDIPIEHVGPLHHVVVGATQTRRHTQSVADAFDGSFEHQLYEYIRGAGGVTATPHRARAPGRQNAKSRCLHQLPRDG